jgi:hypothetical protein
MAERLPTLYRDGDLVRGLADVLGLQLEILDEEARIVQRAHWFDATVERAEAAALGALLDVAVEPWQSLGEYRAWFHALRTARLRGGGVTGPALRTFVEMYVEAFEATNGIDVVPPFRVPPPATPWSAEPVRAGHAFVENPPRTTGARLGGPSAIEPLTQQVVVNHGIDAAPASLLLTGTDVTEYAPVVVNLTTGRALAYLGDVRTGDRLWIEAQGDGSVTAQLGRADVTSRLRGIERLTPGTAWSAADVAPEPRALELLPGANDLWFLPVAHLDVPGLDRVLLALAGLDLHQGRWDAGSFDRALFYQDPGAVVDLVWTERVPAAVRVDLDAAAMLSPAGRLDEALDARDQLAASVGDGVRRLAAAGVATEVRLRPRHESQRQLDHLVFISGRRHRAVGTVGVDRLRDVGGLFGVTGLDDSTYQ